MKYSLIVAASDNGVIGNNGNLPWHLPEEMSQFKKITSGGNVIMGSKTFKSIGRSLPNRRNIVITSSVLDSDGNTDVYKTINSEYDNTFFVGKIEDVEPVVEVGKESFVIGGSSIYKQFLEKDLINKVYFSKIKGIFDGDTYFDITQLDLENDWKIIKEEDKQSFMFYIMERK